MTQTFTQDVFIDGSADATQLRTQANATQTQPLQTWEDSGAAILARVTGDGLVQVGDPTLSPAVAMVEANQAIVPSSAKPKQGWQSLGRITGSAVDAISGAISWVVHELELLGTGPITGLHTALRAKLTHNSSGSSNTVELRAADLQATNLSGVNGTPVNKLTGARGTASNGTNAWLTKAIGVEAAITNDPGGNVTEASAIEVATPVNNGTIGTLYGLRVNDMAQGYPIFTGTGPVRLGDHEELKVLASAPAANPPASFVKFYTKLVASIPHLFAKDSAGTEYDLSAGGNGAGMVLPATFNARLTLTSGTPITTSDVTGATQVYLTPFQGNQVALYNGTIWNLRALSEISIKLTDTQNGNTTNGSATITNLTDTSQFIVGMYVAGSGIPASTTILSIDSTTQITLSANATATATGVPLTFKVRQNTTLDVFVFDNSGTPKLEMVAWNEPSKSAITGATNATPIVITSNSHGLSNDQIITIQDVGGNTAANGTFRVASVTVNTFALTTLAGANVAGNGAYTSGGIWRRADQNTARATALATQDSVLAKTGALTRRYVGTVRVGNTAGQTEDSVIRRLVWNYYNRRSRNLKAVESAPSWSYTTATWRAVNSDLSIGSTRVEVVIGWSEDFLHADTWSLCYNLGSTEVSGGVGIDSTTVNSAITLGSITGGNAGTAWDYTPMQSTYEGWPGVGYHYVQWLEISFGNFTTIWYGTNGYTYTQTGLIVDVMG